MNTSTRVTIVRCRCTCGPKGARCKRDTYANPDWPSAELCADCRVPRHWCEHQRNRPAERAALVAAFGGDQ